MAGHVVKFPNITLSATTIGIGGTITTQRFPMLFAREVMVLWKSVAADVPASATVNGAGASGATFLSLSAIGYAVKGAVASALNTGGVPIGIVCTDGKVLHAWGQGSITAAGTALTGPVTADVWVLYDTEEDIRRAEQVGVVPV